ncbi:MAG TPA: hypothetical protein VMU26_14400 [Candidatus Polarisedimenticolia bacterium]|nr:hypothetical protein [Candidatus Polarisedimenticolia bacterium]
MADGQNSRLGSPPILFVVVVLSVSALTASLVTRTFHLKLSHCITVQSNSPQAVRQHLDRDAVEWEDPVPNVVPLRALTFHSRMARTWLRFPTLILDENLYNRPPPSC